MGYVRRVVRCGCVIEYKKMASARANRNTQRGANVNRTSQTQEKANERKAEERLRWRLNANYGPGDYHVVLHYRDKERGFFQCREDLRNFLRSLRENCRRAGEECRYIAVTETKRMTNVHHHVILNRMPLQLIESAWEKVAGSASVSLRPLDKRGNHMELASYLVKESRRTMERYAEAGVRGKRFTCSKGLVIPQPVYEHIAAAGWKEEPRPHKGAYLWKNKDGDTVQRGATDSGAPYQLYFEIYNTRQDEKRPR